MTDLPSRRLRAAMCFVGVGLGFASALAVFASIDDLVISRLGGTTPVVMALVLAAVPLGGALGHYLAGRDRIRSFIGASIVATLATAPITCVILGVRLSQLESTSLLQSVLGALQLSLIGTITLSPLLCVLAFVVAGVLFAARSLLRRMLALDTIPAT